MWAGLVFKDDASPELIYRVSKIPIITKDEIIQF